MSLNQASPISLRDQWARNNAVLGVLDEAKKLLPNLDIDIGETYDSLPPPPVPLDGAPKLDHIPFLKVGIIGAGAAGLFTGLIIDYLNEQVFKKKKFEIQYDILEASKEDRVGGRLYTYNFSSEPHDYYDVGAMRFPENPIMQRLFALFNKLGLEKKDPKTSPPKGSLIPYYMKNGDTGSPEPWHYNDITKWGNYNDVHIHSQSGDPFEINTKNTIPAGIFRHTPDDVMNSTIEPLREALRRDAQLNPPRALWLGPFDEDDSGQLHSENIRGSLLPLESHLRLTTMIPLNGWKHLMGTNWYDQAHSETVLESLDFAFDNATKWYCILGGAQELAKRMEAKLVHKPAYERRVTAIKAINSLQMEVTVKGEPKPLRYAGLFGSVPLGCLRQIDTSEARLNYATKQAMRSLGYGASAKVGIKFKRAWWIHDLGQNNIKLGGLGHSDLNLRTCVYPSYNLYDPPDPICCLTLDHKQKVRDEVMLKELLLRDLARLHKSDHMTEAQAYKLISDNYVDHYAFDWYKEPNAAGAFAFFRPQQFSGMWSKLIQPSGDFMIIGEAASPHHAWVVGALESAVHGVHAWLGQYRKLIPGGEEAIRILETYDKGNPFIGLPPYMDPNLSKWHSYLGIIRRFGPNFDVEALTKSFEKLQNIGSQIGGHIGIKIV
ncbi:hypothetical protein LOZ39_000363 [Ophidiomyces ophidiicola]|uniref:Uncharacterized protein n=1 Tax=Ophidiomyces ophidiicola TaxID=1387563 RepID=A0ACB8V3S5_9EURO|nr:uncharacterized protein LOZ57_005443 [Ophidiomyces ophidiicola]KAI1917371.1 hypothetical protein LOZ61_000434 [Ophidiomyces ophidiicola]KAI1924402.1 hypothetical protein LOZ64_000727 [Ophidiomyces ophidiicola]KAI1929303.1 hypothetical protein LOZ60_001772 [Ophidiomyces ophidiicola]KAI1942220.1 hypothetical protein LOZ57_005443 [Ophidiomyces ophidiicola]KAI1955358.1 hypothetical protein LOZ59_004596 [Ophidiomyces ophidiicola]